ncbi:MAG: DUF192 domain-containing protein [Alphaproteobacteria bacterium]|nr:DUF192 domain-containing protein [Alphaproteobacteria bacterium]
MPCNCTCRLKFPFVLKAVLLGALVLALGSLFWMRQSGSQGVGNRPHFAQSTLVITGAGGARNKFFVEVANSKEEQAYGLMFLRALDEDKGMVFPYHPPREVAFWMENTLIPLDMLFVRPDGTIGRIVAEAKPQDMTPIPSQVPVIAVIEIGGGVAKKKGIAVGDKVEMEGILGTSR